MRLSSIVLQDRSVHRYDHNNIRIGRPDATMDEVVAGCKGGRCPDEIVQMEAGYETVVGTGLRRVDCLETEAADLRRAAPC